MRARDSLLSRLYRDSLHATSHTQRANLTREQTAWTRSYDLSSSLFPVHLSVFLSLSLFLCLPCSSPHAPRKPGVSFARSVLLSLSLSFSSSLSRTRTSLAFLPADAGKLSRRCQARFHPPAHKGEPKRAGQSNGAIPPVGMAGVYRRPAIGNVAFSSSVLSPFVENSREPRARLAV